MPALLATALALSAVAVSAAESPAHTLPVGSAIVVVADGHLDPAAKPGRSVRGHLRDALTLDGQVLAPAGTLVRVVLAGHTPDHRVLLGVDDFRTSLGILPLQDPTPVPAVDAGTTIEARTAARVRQLGDRYAIDIPFPFRTSNEVPASAYTPTPARTARPFIRATPSPAPTRTKNPAG